MNQIFSLRRFSLQFRKAVMERPMGVLGTCLLNLAGSFLIYFFFQSMNAFHPAQDLGFIAGLLAGSCLIASVVFGNFSSEANGISYLTLPGSTFEKWLVGILITAMYIALFFLFFRLMDNFFVDMYHHKLNPKDPRYAEQFAAVWKYDFFIDREFYALLFLCLSIMLIGSIQFNRMAFVKTALLILIIFFLLFVINNGIVRLMLPNVVRANPFESVTLLRDGNESNISLPESSSEKIITLLGIGCPVVLLLLSYFKLKEKEI